MLKIQQWVIWRKGSRECNRTDAVTGKGKESMDYSCQFPQCKQLLFDGLCLGQSSLLNTNSPRQPSLALLCSRDDELSQTHRRSRRLSATLCSQTKWCCVVWGEAKFKMECEVEGRRGALHLSSLKLALAQMEKCKVCWWWEDRWGHDRYWKVNNTTLFNAHALTWNKT